MNRLKKISNHVSPFMHEQVKKDVIDKERTLRRSSSDSYLIAKQLVMDTTLVPTNENLLLLTQMIDKGKFSDLGKSKDNWDRWVSRTKELFKVANKGDMKMKRLIRKADAIALDPNLALNAQDVLSKIQALDARLNQDTLMSDTAANRSAVYGFIDDSGQYVLEIYSFNDGSNNHSNAVVVAPIVNGVPSTNYDINIKSGPTRQDVKNDIISSGYSMSNGTKLLFTNQYTTLPPEENEENPENV